MAAQSGCASSSTFKMIFVVLVVLAVWARSAASVSYRYTYATCRLPVNDRSRNYYMVRTGLTTETHVACIEYGDVQEGGPTVMAFGCEGNGDGTAQLVLLPHMVDKCTKRIAIKDYSAGMPCNVLSREYETNNYLHRRERLRLTGQNATASTERLDRLYVSDMAYMCVERFGESGSPVPETEAAKCSEGRLTIPTPAVEALHVDGNPYDCRKMNLEFFF